MVLKLIIIYSLFIASPAFGDIIFSGVRSTKISINGTIFVNQAKKLMPIGDSITKGSGDANNFSYRDHLQNSLGTSEYSFVGQYSDPSSDPIYSVRHEGIGGNKTSDVKSRINVALDTYLIAPNNAGSIILLHIGTNDAKTSGGISDSVAVQNVEDIINFINLHDTALQIYIALIIPSTSLTENAEFVTYNTALKIKLEALQATRNIVIVDMYAAINNHALCTTLTDCYNDTLHPNDFGYQVMAEQWDACISSTANTNCNGN